MITKETFVKTMERLKTLDKKMNAVDAAMKELSPDFCSFYITEIFDATFELLKATMDDAENWIDYFVYERDWLRDFKIGDVEVDGEPVKIYSWGDVYDFIVGGKEKHD